MKSMEMDGDPKKCKNGQGCWAKNPSSKKKPLSKAARKAKRKYK
jgi:hypothetical protein